MLEYGCGGSTTIFPKYVKKFYSIEHNLDWFWNVQQEIYNDGLDNVEIYLSDHGHDVSGKDGAGKIKLRAAPKGTGIIAGGPVRAVCEVLGIKDIVAKSIGTANPHNVIRACMKALQKQNSPKNISILRNKKITEIIEKRG